MGYSYEHAMKTLTEAEKNRFLACFFTMENTNSMTDWDKATASYGAASAASMKVMVNAAFRKIADFKDDGTNGDPKSPKTIKAKGGRKRKAATDGSDNGDGTSITATPASKKRGKQTKTVVKEEDEADEDHGNTPANAESGALA